MYGCRIAPTYRGDARPSFFSPWLWLQVARWPKVQPTWIRHRQPPNSRPLQRPCEPSPPCSRPTASRLKKRAAAIPSIYAPSSLSTIRTSTRATSHSSCMTLPAACSRLQPREATGRDTNLSPAHSSTSQASAVPATLHPSSIKFTLQSSVNHTSQQAPNPSPSPTS